MNAQAFDFMMQMDKVPDKVVKEGLAYAGQSGIELRHTPNPTQSDLDLAIAEAYIRGFMAGKKNGT